MVAVALAGIVGIAYAYLGLNERPYNTIMAFACGLLSCPSGSANRPQCRS